MKQEIVAQQSLFKIGNQSAEAATKVSYLIAEAIAKRGKPFSDGELVKNCLEIFTDVVCPTKKSLVENTFMVNKEKEIAFLDDNFWLNDLAFLIDMTKCMAELNVRLQGKYQLVHRLYEHIVTFIEKLNQKILNATTLHCVHRKNIQGLIGDYKRSPSVVNG
ncbi:hypothetical protein HELRODRAFT_178962 [Helobdella robusta]|uniref:Uncharacterized protein n=1 Tax=Helobdella robusta TaxID=6412 RepID=T1FDZ2_HELRO|nr:hypothetical protein HELRODRAFT_178962 [Helobdella robusta]ESN95782.1 hypothetical protein HELRODRAFT_178962 [Helobdella robusta]